MNEKLLESLRHSLAVCREVRGDDDWATLEIADIIERIRKTDNATEYLDTLFNLTCEAADLAIQKPFEPHHEA